MFKFHSLILIIILTSCDISNEEVQKHIAWNIKSSKKTEVELQEKSSAPSFPDWNYKFSKNISCFSSVYGCIKFDKNNPFNKGINGSYFIILKNSVKIEDFISELKTYGRQIIDFRNGDIEQLHRINKHQIHLMHDEKESFDYLFFNEKNNEIRVGKILFT